MLTMPTPASASAASRAPLWPSGSASWVFLGIFLCTSPGLSTFKVHNFRMPLPATVSLKLLSFPCHCHANLLELIYRLGSPRAVTNASFKRIQCKRGAVNAVVGPNKSQVTRFDETFVPSIVLK